MDSFPAVFLSHGAPVPLQSGAAPEFLKQLGKKLGFPKAIECNFTPLGHELSSCQDFKGYPLHSSFTYGVFNMAAYAFAPEAQSVTYSTH